MRALKEMSLEELWRLFPIQLREYRPEYAQWYEEARAQILSVVGPVREIHHVGSTAVPGLKAKPIVDILLVLGDEGRLSEAAGKLESEGWTEMSRSAGRVSLNRGYTPAGFAERVFHLHLRLPGDCDEILFRDELRKNPGAAARYRALKEELSRKFTHDRDAYTAGKTAFIREILEGARGTVPTSAEEMESVPTAAEECAGAVRSSGLTFSGRAGRGKGRQELPFLRCQTPVGPLYIACEGDAVTEIRFSPGSRPVIEEANCLPDAAASCAEGAARQLREYFAGERRTFSLLVRPEGTPFQLAVWAELARIPYGETRSYSQLASALGRPGAARAVGGANHRNPIAVVLPCHRVVGAGGSLTGYAGGLEVKEKLLELERRHK